MYKNTINQCAGTVLDHLMNDPNIQHVMSEYITKQYPGFNFAQPDHLTEDEWEASPEYALYYSATTEFHTKVLAQAMLNLSSDPLEETG